MPGQVNIINDNADNKDTGLVKSTSIILSTRCKCKVMNKVGVGKVVKSSFCCFTDSGGFCNSLGGHQSLRLPLRSHLLPCYLGEDYNSQKATLCSLDSASLAGREI